jgi:hypothetical protein
MGLFTSVGSAVLARSATVLGEIPPPLQETGAFRKWVLEQPVPLGVVLVLAAIVAWFILRGQGKAREGTRVGGILVLLAIAVVATGSLVETEQEKLKARARELVAAVASANTTRVGPMLTDDVIAQPFGLPRDVILSKMESTLGGSLRIKEHKISTLRAALEGKSMARTQLRVHVVADGALYAGPVGSWWMIHWRKDAAGVWKADEIEMQQLDGMDVSSIRP